MKFICSKLSVGVAILGILTWQAPDAEARVRARARLKASGLAQGALYTGRILVRSQLRSCVIQQKAINAEGDMLDSAEVILQEKSYEIKKLEEVITRRQALVDEYNQESVDSFNALISKQRRLVAAYNASIQTHNSRADKFNTDLASFKENCSGRAYYESDMRAVLAGN